MKRIAKFHKVSYEQFFESCKDNFSESEISGGEMKFITRNSIDRFTAGTKDSALYKEKTCYNGNCDLEIFINKNGLKDAKKILL